MFPKEHGAWNCLLVCLAAGWIALGHFDRAALAATVLWSSAFLLRGPWNLFRQYRKADPDRARKALGTALVLLVLLGASTWEFLALAAPSSLRTAGWAGIPLASVLLFLVLWKRSLRFALAEVLGFLGLSLAAPVVALSEGTLREREGWWLWSLFGGYFLLGLALVRLRQGWLRLSRQGGRVTPSSRFSGGWWVLVLYAVWVEGLGDSSGGASFLLAAPLYGSLRALAAVAWGRAEVPMMRLGVGEMVNSLLFLAIWAWTWTVWRHSG